MDYTLSLVKSIIFRIVYLVISIALFWLLLFGFSHYIAPIPQKLFTLILIIGGVAGLLEPRLLFQFIKMAIYWIAAYFVSCKFFDIQEAPYLFGIGFLFSTIAFYYGLLEKVIKLIRMLVGLLVSGVMFIIRKIKDR